MKFRLVIDREKEEEVVVTAHGASPLTRQIEALVRRQEGVHRIAAYTEDDLVMLPVAEIQCVTVIDGRTCAIVGDGSRYRLRQRLYELEEMLPSCFIRINKSTLANETKLTRFAASFNGAVDAVFQCGYREYVSRRCFAEIKRRFAE